MEKEIIETYHFNPKEFVNGKTSDGITFRDVIKDLERDFHIRHSGNYAYNLYANSATMHLLELGNGAAPFLLYGMDLTQGRVFDPVKDGNFNYEIDKHSKNVLVYAIDSAYMTKFDEEGDPIFGVEDDIFPLTLLIDDTMKDGTVRLATPTMDDDDDGEEKEPVLTDNHKYVFA